METEKAYVTSKGFISVSGIDSPDFLQNIISNDIKKVTDNNCIFASLLTPQGKLLFEFIILKREKSYLIECNEELTEDLFNKLNSYILRSKVEIKVETNLTSIDIPFLKFKELNFNNLNLINYKNYLIFEDPRVKNTLARAVIEQSKIKYFLNDLNIEASNEKYLFEFNKRIVGCGAPAYLINREALKTALSQHKLIGAPDWPAWGQRVKFFGIYPWLIKETGDGSTVPIGSISRVQNLIFRVKHPSFRV